jgi:hypothetical protein
MISNIASNSPDKDIQLFVMLIKMICDHLQFTGGRSSLIY